ncbi:MAG: proton-conducting transporter membrane subunit, partial [Gemmatimonadales bacterium]
FYLLFYTLATIAAFAVLIAKGRGGERDVTLDDLAGLAETHPLLAGVMAISMLSLMGFPGTAGFVGKWYILLAATGGGYVTVAVVLVLASVVSAGYYLPVIMAMYMKPRATERAHQQTVLPNVVRVMLAAMLVALVYFGVYPGSALETARLGSSTFLPRMMTAQSARPMQITPLPPGHPGTPGGDSPQLPPGHPGTPGATRQLPPGHPGVPVR